MNNLKNNVALIVSIALVVFAILFFISARSFSRQGEYVEVKGLSERIVKADTAIWSITFEVKSNSIDTLYADTERNLNVITSFLRQKGFDESEISVAPVNIYQDTYKEAVFRYNSTNNVAVYTNKVDQAKSASNETLNLVKQGVVLSQNHISFEFSDLNSIKPEMLAEAIKNAKETAIQIARNSDARINKVSRGNQGVFDITNKDPGSPEYKKIRLVSTLRFQLK